MYGDLLFTSVEESYYALTGKVRRCTSTRPFTPIT